MTRGIQVLGTARQFLRGNVHTHSTTSDGALAAQDVASWYESRGYDFLSVTDHVLPEYGYAVTDPSRLRATSLTLIPGVEIHPVGTRFGDPWHLIALGMPLSLPFGDYYHRPRELVARIREAGGWVCLAHPASQGVNEADFDKIRPIDAIEVYNEGTVWWDDRPHGWPLCDAIAARGIDIGAVAVDDAHFNGKPDHGKAWLMVDTEDRSPSGIVRALKQRRYFATQGPSIWRLVLSQTHIEVACSPAAFIGAMGKGARSLSQYGEGLTVARFPLEAFEGGYVRLTVIDQFGARAWTNPIQLNNHCKEGTSVEHPKTLIRPS